MTSPEQKTIMQQRIADHLESSAEVKRQSIQACSQSLENAVELLVTAYTSGNKLLLSGNGGSAADCQHMATELVARLSHEFERPSLSAIALTTDSSFITAYSNDDHFDGIFERQIQGHGRPGDVLLAISTSGTSLHRCLARCFENIVVCLKIVCICYITCVGNIRELINVGLKRF